MEPENESVQEDILAQEEEQISEKPQEEIIEEHQEEEETISIPKAKFKTMQRKAMAYDADKNKQTPPKEITNEPLLSEELKLIARGLSDEEIEKAKIIAKGNGTSLQDALKDDMFIAYQANMAEKKKREDAKLGASKGSGESQDSSDIKPDMTRDEHLKAFKKLMG